MSTVNYKCPCCGSALAYSGASNKLECASCGNSYELDVLEAVTLEQEGSNVEFIVKAESLNNAEGVSAYICKNCGAELMTDDTTTATECPYCGSPTILPDRIQGGVKPEKVVPFVITKEKAAQMFNDYFKGKRLLPNVFLNSRNRISEMRKLYAPYWLFNCDAYADIVYDATKEHTRREGDYEVTQTDHYAVRRCGTIGFDSIPVDGSVKLDDKISESIEPFDLSKAVPFQSAVLAGAMADTADVKAEDCKQRVAERVETSTEDAMRNTISGYDSVSVKKKFIKSEHGTATPVLMPVWMITTEKTEDGKKKVYTFAINGQTGKLTCDVPYAKGKAWAWFGGVFAGITAAGCGIMAAMDNLTGGTAAGCAVAGAIAGFIVVSILKGQLKTAHMQSGAEHYVRSGSLDLRVKRDSYLYRTTTRRKIEKQEPKKQ